MEKQREQTRFIIQRFDTYISSANTKGNFLLAFNTFLTGSVVTNYSKLKELITSEFGLNTLNVVLIVLVFVTLLATIFIIGAVYPFVISGNSSANKYHSHVFFNSVAEFKDAKSFNDSYSAQTDANVDEDLARQAFHLAEGLKAKYRLLEWSMRIVYAELFLLFLVLLTLIIF